MYDNLEYKKILTLLSNPDRVGSAPQVEGAVLLSASKYRLVFSRIYTEPYSVVIVWEINKLDQNPIQRMSFYAKFYLF